MEQGRESKKRWGMVNNGMLKNFLLGGFFLSTVYFGLRAYELEQKVICLESRLCEMEHKETAPSQNHISELPLAPVAVNPNSSAQAGSINGEPAADTSTVNNSTKAPQEEPAVATDAVPSEVVDWRINSISKFVDISEDQRAQLKTVFSSGRGDPLSQSRTLKEILGEDNYAAYKEARTRARNKIEDENREKDILYQARIINLTPKEESILRDVTLRVDQEIEARKQADDTKPASPYEGLARYLQYQKLRRELIAAELKSELPKDKYEAYLKVDADSAASEMGVWHGE
jgi:hypothetical protein